MEKGSEDNVVNKDESRLWWMLILPSQFNLFSQLFQFSSHNSVCAAQLFLYCTPFGWGHCFFTKFIILTFWKHFQIKA